MLRKRRALRGRIDSFTVRSRALAGNALGDPHRREVRVYLPPEHDADPRPAVLDGVASEELPELEVRLLEHLEQVTGVFRHPGERLGGHPIETVDHIDDAAGPAAHLLGVSLHLEEHLGESICKDKGDFDSLGGLLVHLAGQVPVIGETVVEREHLVCLGLGPPL